VDKAKKLELVEHLKTIFNETSMALIVKNNGIKVSQIRELRRQFKKNDCSYLVTKNKLAKIAANGTKFSQLSELLNGPTAIAYSNDPVAVAKLIATFAKDNEKLEIVGAVFNESLMSADQVKKLATLPSLDEIRATIVGVLSAPATRLATVLQAPAAELARVVDAYSKK
jgi:large subunit ribosomal protein L10